MSIPEQTGKVANNAIDAFRNNPLCLAAVLLAAFFGLLTFFAYQRDADRKAKTVDILLERCYPAPSEKNHDSPVRPQDLL